MSAATPIWIVTTLKRKRNTAPNKQILLFESDAKPNEYADEALAATHTEQRRSRGSVAGGDAPRQTHEVFFDRPLFKTNMWPSFKITNCNNQLMSVCVCLWEEDYQNNLLHHIVTTNLLTHTKSRPNEQQPHRIQAPHPNEIPPADSKAPVYTATALPQPRTH